MRIERRKTVGCGRNNGIDDAPTNAYPFSREINFLNGIYQISIICIYMVISVAFESFLQKIYRDIVRDRSYFFDKLNSIKHRPNESNRIESNRLSVTNLRRISEFEKAARSGMDDVSCIESR